MKKSKVYKVIKESVIKQLKEIFQFKRRGICDDFVDAKRAGGTFDESIFDRYKSTRQAK